MPRIYAILLFCLLGAEAVQAQQPDVKGGLIVNLGFNQMRDQPGDMDLEFFPSRTAGIHYLYNLPVGESKFSLHAGPGFTFEKYSFASAITLNKTFSPDSTQIVNLDPEEFDNLDKSQLNIYYFDLPVELRFYTRKDAGLMFAVGGKVGFNIHTQTKLRYEDNGDEVVNKTRRDLNINGFRYGLTARAGFEQIHLSFHQTLNPLFTSGRGPGNEDIITYSLSLGVSLF